MTRFYAQPYNLDAVGFYFEEEADYLAKVKNLKDSFGQPVEEFEIQFIDGEEIDGLLFRALYVSQGNIGAFIQAVDDFTHNQKLQIIIAVDEIGYDFDLKKDHPDQFDIDIYRDVSMRELAEQFVDEGLFGDIPERLASYLDYEAISCDLQHDYTHTRLIGVDYVYRSA